MSSEKSRVCLLDLPDHVLVDIASYLGYPQLKALALVHRYLVPAVEHHLYRRISLPLRNQYYAVQAVPEYVTSLAGGGLECDYNLSTTYEPVKPALAGSLEMFGWKEDVNETNHLVASMRYMTSLLEPKNGVYSHRRAMYPRELVLDLKKQYHDVESDMAAAAYNTPYISPYSGHSGNKGWLEKWDDPLASRLAMLRLAEARRDESPDHEPALLEIFANFPKLPGVKKLTVTLYESWQGYLDHVFALVPNLEELFIRPHSLLTDSPLTFESKEFRNLPIHLKSIEIDGMLGCFQRLVGDLLNASDRVERLDLRSAVSESRRG